MKTTEETMFELDLLFMRIRWMKRRVVEPPIANAMPVPRDKVLTGLLEDWEDGSNPPTKNQLEKKSA
jgi:hypothetical protein